MGRMARAFEFGGSARPVKGCRRPHAIEISSTYRLALRACAVEAQKALILANESVSTCRAWAAYAKLNSRSTAIAIAEFVAVCDGIDETRAGWAWPESNVVT